MKIFNNIVLVFFLFFLSSCAINSGFVLYSMDGKEIRTNNNRQYNDSAIKLFFHRDEIEKEFVEVNIVGSNHHYYGDFYFDETFMNSLNKRVSLLSVDALIFEEDLSRNSFYNDQYIYFTTIRYTENN